jgi:hypothetical protein
MGPVAVIYRPGRSAMTSGRRRTKRRVLRCDQYNPVRGSDPAEVNRASLRNSKPDLERRLDQTLLETFPASDSMAIIIC